MAAAALINKHMPSPSSIRFLLCSVGTMSLVLLGAGCRSSVQQSVSPPASIPSPPSTSEPLVVTPPQAEKNAFTDSIEPWRGPFLAAQESTIWLVTHKNSVLGGRPSVRGTFIEHGSIRRGNIVSQSLTENGFGFSLNWGPEEKEQGYGTTTRVRLPDDQEALQGEIVMEGSRRTFALKRATDLPSFTLRRVATSTLEGDQEVCSFSLEYPELVVSTRVSESARTAINTKIVQYIQSDNLSPTAQVETFMRDCKRERLEVKGMSDPSLDQPKYAQTVEPDVIFANQNVVSLLSLNYSYTGGAHGNYGYDAQTFDLTTGRELGLEDLVKPEHLREFYQRVSVMLLKNNRDLIFEEFAKDIQQFLDDRKPTTTQSQREQYGRLKNWYLVEDGIVFFYNPYEIAPYAAGIQEVRISFTDWDDLAQPNVRSLLAI